MGESPWICSRCSRVCRGSECDTCGRARSSPSETNAPRGGADDDVQVGIVTHATLRGRVRRPWAWWAVLALIVMNEIYRSLRGGHPSGLLALALVSGLVTLVVLGVLRRRGQGESIRRGVAALLRPLAVHRVAVVVMALDGEAGQDVEYAAVIVDPRPWPEEGAWLPETPLPAHDPPAAAPAAGGIAPPIADAGSAGRPGIGRIAPATNAVGRALPGTALDPGLLASEEVTGDGVDLMRRLRTEPSRLIGRRVPLDAGRDVLVVRRIEPATPEGRAPAPAIHPGKSASFLPALLALGAYLVAVAALPPLQ